MKKLISLLVVCILISTMVLSASANTFVPSITYKDGPSLKTAVLSPDAADEMDVSSCVVITSILKAKNKSTDITQDARDLLLEVYDALKSGEMELPMDSSKYEIRELVDVSFKQSACIEKEDHLVEHKNVSMNKDEKLDEEDVTIKVRFRLGVSKYTKVIAYSYDEETGEWTEVKNLENNGDGSVTGEFDHFCPVAFLVEKGGTASTPKTGDAAGQNLLLWIILMAVCVVAIVVLLILRKRKK